MPKCSRLLAALLMISFPIDAALGASHREAPLTAIDRTADITDFYAFVSPDDPETVTLILCADPLLEPSNGPNYFPFDDHVLYTIYVDNDHDAQEDVWFEFRFETEQRLPRVPVGFLGAGGGVPAPANSPPPIDPGFPLIPRAITALDGPGSEGLGLRQTYRVTLVEKKKNSKGKKAKKPKSTELSSVDGGSLFAVPSNAGPRTMPDYAALRAQGVFELEGGIRVFAGTTDDTFNIDLGAAFDSLNLRVVPGPDSTGIPGVLSDAQDAAAMNFVADDVSGFNVNTIAIQVPIQMLTQTQQKLPDTDPDATLGTWGETARATLELRVTEEPVKGIGPYVQVQRMANPLFNELLIGTGFKDLWSRSEPRADAQFAPFALDPLIARAAQAAFGGAFDIPAPPRTDLLPLVGYLPPIAAPGTPAGPVADLLRLNTGVPPTPFDAARRLGLLGGDPAGFPNGRRPFDDVTDLVLRIVVGGVLGVDAQGMSLDRFPNNRLGDGVNLNELRILETFPFMPPAHDGRNSRHVDPGEPGCAAGDCPVHP